jgi:hypothetical protein
MTFLRTYVPGSTDAILNEVGRITAVSLVGAHLGPRVALGHPLVVPPGNVSLQVWIGMTSRDWWLSSHKGQWRLTTGASVAAWWLSGITTVYLGRMWESTHMEIASATWAVSLEYRYGAASLQDQHSNGSTNPCGGVGMRDGLIPPPRVTYPCGFPWP